MCVSSIHVAAYKSRVGEGVEPVLLQCVPPEPGEERGLLHLCFLARLTNLVKVVMFVFPGICLCDGEAVSRTRMLPSLELF